MPRIGRRKFQFELRSLLAGVVLAGLLLGLGLRWHWSRKLAKGVHYVGGLSYLHNGSRIFTDELAAQLFLDNPRKAHDPRLPGFEVDFGNRQVAMATFIRLTTHLASRGFHCFSFRLGGRHHIQPFPCDSSMGLWDLVVDLDGKPLKEDFRSFNEVMLYPLMGSCRGYDFEGMSYTTYETFFAALKQQYPESSGFYIIMKIPPRMTLSDYSRVLCAARRVGIPMVLPQAALTASMVEGNFKPVVSGPSWPFSELPME